MDAFYPISNRNRSIPIMRMYYIYGIYKRVRLHVSRAQLKRGVLCTSKGNPQVLDNSVEYKKKGGRTPDTSGLAATLLCI